MRKLHLILLFLFVSQGTHASFYIDYQGLKRDEIAPTKIKRIPNGYRLLTDDLNGLVYEIGDRTKEISRNSNFAEDTELKYAIGAIIPEGWNAYVDEKLTAMLPITFSADSEPWLNVLARVGAKYGYKFVVDWDSGIVQISSDEYYKEPDINQPVVVESTEGQSYYIYKTKQSLDKGYMIINGVMVEMKVVD